ncbi:hypothetical protein M407DRAFT_31584, partial [Tulasnella calospora MUT 4182]
MEDPDSQPAAATAAAPTSNTDGSPMPSLVTTPSTNASLSPRTPASPPFTSVSDSPQKAFPKLNIGGTPTAGGLDLSTTPIGGPTSPASDGAPTSTNNRYKSLADAFANRGPDGLVHDIAIDDLTIAEDGTYLETSSAHAARELKRRYDRTLGVGIKPGVRSPYAITVTQDAQGQPLYRLSSSRPGNGVSVTENEPTTSAVPEAMSKSRRLRLSVGALLTSKTSRSTAAGPVQQQQSSSSSTTQVNKTVSSNGRKPATTRLVRNARSTSELRSRSGSGAAAARYGKQSVSRSTNALDDSHLIARLAHDGDAFSVLLGWSTDPDNESVSSSKDSVSSHGADDDEFGGGGGGEARSPSTHVANPFGRGVSFTTPHRPLDFSIRRPASPPQLRYMQSFESGLTARADDHPTFMRQFKRTTSATHASASPYSTEVFDVIQNYKGIPLADTLSAVASETVFKLSSTPSALPKNDPRFVIWGDVRPGGGDDDDESNLSQSAASSPTLEGRDDQHRRRRGSSVTESQSSAASTSGAQEPLGQR